MSDPTPVASSPVASSSSSEEFADQANQASPGIVWEFLEFVRYNKKWWLTPIILVLMLVGALVLLGGGAAAPFIYTLF